LLSLTVESYKRKSVKSAFFEGVGDLERKFQTKGASPTNHYWCQRTRLIALSCGIKIYAVRCLVLSQRTRDIQTDGQNYNPQGRASITASRGKNAGLFHHHSSYGHEICMPVECENLAIPKNSVQWRPLKKKR